MRETPDSLLEPQLLRYAQELGQLQALRRAHERLLPAGLDPASRAAPEPKAVTATVLFSDIRGFSRLAELLADEPSRLLTIVNEHISVVVRAITQCGGVIEKFVGDGVLASFGARSDLLAHREQALAAAIALVGANEALNRRRFTTWGFRLEVGVGVATGAVIVGSIGPPERSELGILGDSVNVAARLVGQAAAGEVLLTASVRQGVTRRVQADLIGHSALRGRVGELGIYRISLLGHSGHPTAPAYGPFGR